MFDFAGRSARTTACRRPPLAPRNWFRRGMKGALRFPPKSNNRNVSAKIIHRVAGAKREHFENGPFRVLLVPHESDLCFRYYLIRRDQDGLFLGRRKSETPFIFKTTKLSAVPLVQELTVQEVRSHQHPAPSLAICNQGRKVPITGVPKMAPFPPSQPRQGCGRSGKPTVWRLGPGGKPGTGKALRGLFMWSCGKPTRADDAGGPAERPHFNFTGPRA